jgi:hypothetical protein
LSLARPPPKPFSEINFRTISEQSFEEKGRSSTHVHARVRMQSRAHLQQVARVMHLADSRIIFAEKERKVRNMCGTCACPHSHAATRTSKHEFCARARADRGARKPGRNLSQILYNFNYEKCEEKNSSTLLISLF